MDKNCRRRLWTAPKYVVIYQFGRGILKMVGPKKQYFCPRINILKGFFFKSFDELQFVKKCQNRTFKVNFRSQKSTEFKKKKNLGLGQIFCPKDYVAEA